MDNNSDKSQPLNQRVYLSALRRLHQIDREIAAGSFPCAERLSSITGVTPRTIKRDLSFMRDNFHAPVLYSRQRGGYFYAVPGWCLPLTRLSEGELLAFFIAENALRLTGHTPEALQLKTALAKLASLLPDVVSVNLMCLGESVSFQNLPFLSANPDYLQRLAKSAINQETVEFDYYSPHSRQQTHRRADVLLLHNFAGDWYAISHDHQSGDFRDFHVGRIKRLRETGNYFAPPDHWKAEDYLRRGFFMMRGGNLVTVVIHFDAYQAQWIRERQFFHPDEQREELPDGSLRLSFKIGEKGLAAVARFCLTYAGNCRAEKPAKLKELIREKLQKGINLHQ